MLAGSIFLGTGIFGVVYLLLYPQSPGGEIVVFGFLAIVGARFLWDFLKTQAKKD